MKAFFKRFLLYVLLFVGGYLLVIVLAAGLNIKGLFPNVLDKTGAGFQSNRLKDVQQVTRPVDVLFLGSSEVFTGFDTRVFDSAGYHCFNLGSNAQTPKNSYLIYDRWIKPLKPKVIVYDVYWKVFEIDGAESYIDIATNSTLSLRDVGQGISHFRNPEVWNTLFFNYVGQALFHRYPREQKPRVRGGQYIPGGYVENNGSQTDDLQLSARGLKLNETQFEYFENFLKSCQADGTRVVLVKTPVTREYYGSIVDKEAFFARVSEIGQRYGAEFKDFNYLSMDSHQDFLDKNHLSSSGVVKFNAEFLNWFRSSKAGVLVHNR